MCHELHQLNDLAVNAAPLISIHLQETDRYYLFMHVKKWSRSPQGHRALAFTCIDYESPVLLIDILSKQAGSHQPTKAFSSPKKFQVSSPLHSWKMNFCWRNFLSRMLTMLKFSSGMFFSSNLPRKCLTDLHQPMSTVWILHPLPMPSKESVLQEQNEVRMRQQQW